ncbi:hypothetical protein HDU82_006077 [Entophlyctis luteolus]|nr:hypothetical protein HDU82_006077 [Entophlyctis luteolus]KAJ3388162.1 hypothetical protein HDU84_000242 [Entophlyctis sp. JEL0112]
MPTDTETRGIGGADAGSCDATVPVVAAPVSDLNHHTESASTAHPKPKRSRSASAPRHKDRSKALHYSFKPRPSPLDFETLERDHNPMRGFYVLFWVAMAWYAITSILDTWNKEGMSFRYAFFSQMSDRSKDLLYSDLLMQLSCFTVVLIVKLYEFKIVPLNFAWIVNSVWLGGWFVSVISWALYSNWKWTQSGSFTIHCIAMLMKQASYLMSNSENFWKLQQIPKLESDLAVLKSDFENTVDVNKMADNEKEIVRVNDELRNLRSHLTGQITGLHFPKNLTFFNFVDYMLVPVLVYEIEYPRTEKFRPFNFIHKTAGTFGTLALLIVIVENNILPILALSNELNFFMTIMKLIVPFMICFLLVFFIIFEFICNAFAELTLFADREFYEDWWNSTSFDEYARRWNKPVHEFLYRHVYLQLIATQRMSKNDASLATFFVSSLFHELVMALTGKRLRPWLFLLQMFQLPLIMFAKLPFIKNNKTVGNAFFWVGMFLGPPLLGALYAREHYMNP